MRLLPRPTRPFPVADRTRDGVLYETEHPRLAAVRFLREKIAEKHAGLDPHDDAIFILVALPHEVVWARTALGLCGELLSKPVDQQAVEARYRAILEADVRTELGLDWASRPRPWMTDEPLASRAARPLLFSVPIDPEPSARSAMRAARVAYDERYPEGPVA